MKFVAKTSQPRIWVIRIRYRKVSLAACENSLDSRRSEENAGKSEGPSRRHAPQKSGVTQWFSEEIQPHESSLRSFLHRIFPSLPDIDDLVQESYARLIRAREAGRVSYAKAFLFTTARNAALDIFRRRQIVQIDGVTDIEELSVVEDRPDAAKTVSRQEELSLLAEAVKTLPVRCRQVVTLRMLYAMSHKEIAAELGISDQTVKAQLAKGMRRCAGYLAARGLP